MTNIIGAISIASLLIGAILLMNLIQKAFDRDGVIWGFISILYPPGTYLFCRKDWASYRKPFFTISALLITSLVLWLVIRIIT